MSGKGPSIWDEFTHQHPEKIKNRSNADVAANSYEFYMDDIEAVKNLNVRTTPPESVVPFLCEMTEEDWVC